MYQPQLSIQTDTRNIQSHVIYSPYANNTNATYPIHPDVRLRKLAFYDVLATILQPTSLLPSNPHRIQEAAFYFTLTPQQATDIASNRDMRNGSKPEYTIQVQLRFCLLETSCEQDDFFPPSIVVKVNNKLCQLPNPIPTNRPNVEPKRPPRPVNVTSNVKLSPTVMNNVTVQWCTDYQRAYVISAYLVKKLTSSQLLHRMKAKGIKPNDYTRALIKEKLSEDADSEIATTMLKVSLICPLGKMRMTIPCRASSCSHLQCFDASLYLQMNERKPTWNCPVCDKPALYDTLVIDGYFQDVLNSSLLSYHDTEIELHKDGSWSNHITRKENESLETSNKLEQSVEIISDDIETILDIKPAAISKIEFRPNVAKVVPSNAENNEPSSTTTNEMVDLTQSDSDDDMPMYNVNPINNAQNPILPAANIMSISNGRQTPKNNDNEPLIILLDSPSPPSSPKVVDENSVKAEIISGVTSKTINDESPVEQITITTITTTTAAPTTATATTTNDNLQNDSLQLNSVDDILQPILSTADNIETELTESSDQNI